MLQSSRVWLSWQVCCNSLQALHKCIQKSQVTRHVIEQTQAGDIDESDDDDDEWLSDQARRCTFVNCFDFILAMYCFQLLYLVVDMAL